VPCLNVSLDAKALKSYAIMSVFAPVRVKSVSFVVIVYEKVT
jgi:hypothetical protein